MAPFSPASTATTTRTAAFAAATVLVSVTVVAASATTTVAAATATTAASAVENQLKELKRKLNLAYQDAAALRRELREKAVVDQRGRRRNP
eukprot:100620-Pleurochrysis_carterae.AAC.1